MSADPDKDTACPSPQADTVEAGKGLEEGDTCLAVAEIKRKKPSRSVRFPGEDQLVTQYFEPANPWHDVPTTNRAELAAEYLEACRRHNTTPIDYVLQQIRELPENTIGGGNRAARLTLAECSLAGSAPVDALEAVLRKVQYRRVEVQHCEIDDEGAEALFDMIEYYESANAVSISGQRQFGIRGWQAACRMIKKSAELTELSLSESAVCASHAPVLVRALRTHTCTLRSLCLQRASLRGEPLLCLVIALKSNTSIRELRLPDNQLSVSDAQQLGSLLKLNLHIQLLDLSNNDIQDAGTGHIADALVEQAAQTPPSAGNSPLSPLYATPGGRDARLGLAFLVLWNNQLSRNCAPHLTKALSSSQSLCVLNIGRNALGADTIRALHCGGALVSLGLQCARLGPAAARPLYQLLKADTKLQRLDLRDNRLGVVGLQAILNAMQDNKTLTQIDLDDPEESTTLTAEDSEAATIARLTRDITALCRGNEPAPTEPSPSVHRKISLTCHTAIKTKLQPVAACAEVRSRTMRLRSPAPSPAPSPAGSPVPHNHHNSRFNVTRVTPDRESSTESTSPSTPTRANYCLTPTSRFKVVQVAEPPQIQVHPATQKRPTSRFSVTRNYDAMYNPSVSPTPSSGSPSCSPTPSISPVPTSPTVSTDSSSVLTSADTVTTSSPKVITNPVLTDSVSVTIDSASDVTASSTVMTESSTVSVTSSPSITGSIIGETISTDSSSVTASLPQIMTSSSIVATSSLSPCFVMPSGSQTNTLQTPIGLDKVLPIAESTLKSVDNSIVPAIAMTLSSVIGANLAPISNMTTAITLMSSVTSGVKSSMSPSLAAVPSASNLSRMSEGGLEDSTRITDVDSLRTATELHDVTLTVLDDKEIAKKCEEPKLDIGVVWKKMAETSDVISTVKSKGSIDTLTGSVLSRTSLNTLTEPSEVFTDKVRKEGTRNESLIKLTDSEPQLSNIDASQDTTVSTALPKDNQPKAVPNSRFSISPTPDNFGLTYDDCDKKEIAKPVAIGSQTNVIVTEKQNRPINTDADIFTKIAEITETIAPKVVELKDLPDEIECDEKFAIEDIPILDEMSDVNRDMYEENTLIKAFTDKSSNTKIGKDKNIEIDKQSSNVLPQLLPKNEVFKQKDYVDKFVVESKGPCLIEQENKEGVTERIVEGKEIIKVASKTILKDDLRHENDKPKLPEIEDHVRHIKKMQEFDQSSKIDEAAPSKCITSDINSEMKIGDEDDGVKNKTYSDAVKSDPKYKDKSEQLTHEEEISDSVVKSETKLVKNSVQLSETDKLDVQVEVTVKKESVQHPAKAHSDQNKDYVNIDDITVKKEPKTMKQIEAITEDLGNLIQEMKDMSSKSRKVKSDCTVDIVSIETNTVPGNFNRDIVLKKNKSESSLDSPDLEVSRLMNKKLVGSPFCDSSSSLEISGSSMESLNATENLHATCHVIPKHVVIQESVESDVELDRRKDITFFTGSSIESTSEVTPVNSGNFLNMSVSSNESVSPIIFGKKKKIHDSLSSLEASMSSLDSGRQEKVMVTSADSGIEYSLQQQFENKEDNSSNEGTLTHNSNLLETVKKTEQETLTSSPKRASSLLDVPALKTKGIDRMRKISWVAPSSSFHIPRVEAEKLEKPSHLEKLLSLFQHPTSLFSRGSQSDEERKSASNTPPRKDSSLTSSFWSWGSTIEKEKDEREDSSEATDSTLSERVQVSFVDESFSKKLDSKTPSTDTDNTLSEFQSFPTQTSADKVTDKTTDEELVQKCLGLSLNDKAGSNGNNQRASDTTDLNKPNDFNRNYDVSDVKDKEKCVNKAMVEKDEAKIEPIRPRSFAAVLKSPGSENSLEKRPSPDYGQSVDKLPSKVIRGIKENISPENTLTTSLTNTKALVLELTERQVNNQPIVGAVWEVPSVQKIELKSEEIKAHIDLAPIATIDETSDEAADNTVNVNLEYIDDVSIDERDENETLKQVVLEKVSAMSTELENVDLGKDALSYLVYETQDLEADVEHAVETKIESGSLAQELKEAEIKEMLDLSPELILDEVLEPEVFTPKEIKSIKSPVIPDRAKLKKANSLEDLSQRDDSAKSSPKTKTIAFKVPETQPRDIPRPKLRTMSGSSPKSLPESLNKPCPLTKMDSCMKKRKKVSSLGKMAKDSLLALNMSEDEIAEYRRSYATSAESLRSLESVSEDANSQSGASVDSRCRSCLRTSQESLMSLDSITEDCKCGTECEKTGRSVR